MQNLQDYTINSEDKEIIKNTAEDALRTYVRQDKRLVLGSEEDVLYTRAGVLVGLRMANGPFTKVRGIGGVYSEDKRLGESLIDAVVQAATRSNAHSEVRNTELQNINIDVSVIKSVRITDTPLEDITTGENVPIVESADDSDFTWILPRLMSDNDLDTETCLRRTYSKAGVPEEIWKESQVLFFDVLRL